MAIVRILYCSAIALLCAPLLASAQPPERALRVCVDMVPYPPYTMPDSDGAIQMLARRTADVLNMRLEMVAAPMNRCRALLRAGEVDAMNSASFVPGNREVAVFPSTDGVPTPAQAVATVSFSVLRRVGSSADWDGKQFLQLKTPVLATAGLAAITQRLQDMHQAFDSGGRNTADNLLKLSAGRGELLIQLGDNVNEQIAKAGLTGKIEVLPHPFLTQDFYFVFSKRYYAANSAQAERFWRELGKQKKSPAYQQALKQVR